jgi:NTE family protein
MSRTSSDTLEFLVLTHIAALHNFLSTPASRRGLDASESLLPGRRPPRGTRLSLGLQGGGSFGAFTWGVLDRLLEEETIEFDAVSGTSAGAVNAVVLAAGMAAGGREAARLSLERIWRRISNSGAFAPFGDGSSTGAVASMALDLSTRVVSPYQFNPLDLNPLRDILAEEVDFERLRVSSPVRLLVATTRVGDGQVRIFREHELSLDVVLASTSLPLLHHAIAIEGEWYWDGGYTANPPLTHLVAASKASDIVVVQLTPATYDGKPMLSPQIVKRVQQITFNTPLLKEIDALLALKELAGRKGIFSSRFSRKLQALRLHRISAENTFIGLDQASALNVDWSFLTKLRDSGRAAADQWLATPRLRNSRRKNRLVVAP